MPGSHLSDLSLSARLSCIYYLYDLASVTMNDPKLGFRFKDSDIKHTIDDAIQFFNNTYGLDFSDSPRTNASLSPVILPDFVDLRLTDNHWIWTGNTRSSCYRIFDGGFWITFSANQILYGSYGGDEGSLLELQTLWAMGLHHRWI